MILFLDRIKNKIKKMWYRSVFRAYTKNKKADVQIEGKITLKNPNVRVGNSVTLYPNSVLWGDGEIVLGDNVDVGYGTVIFASKKGGVAIGDDTCIAGQCYIIDMDHGTKKGINVNKQPNVVQEIVIGKDVWIGAGAKILRGSKIGDGAVIGANSVVKGEIPENAIAVGCPAKVVKYRE